MSCFCKNLETTSGPKVNETPRSFSLQPVISLSGSDHNKSQRRPQSGIYPVCQYCSTEQVKQTHVSWSHDPSYLLHGVQVWTQTTVHCEDLLVDDRSNGQAVEAISESLPQLDVVPSLALIVESVDTVD